MVSQVELPAPMMIKKKQIKKKVRAKSLAMSNLHTYTEQLNLMQTGNAALHVMVSIEKWGHEVEGWSSPDPVSPPCSPLGVNLGGQ